MKLFRLTQLSPGYLLLLAGILRLGFVLFSGKLNETEYWEYGQFASQLLAGHGYCFPFTDADLKFLQDQYYPSALMPPGYVFFFLPFQLVNDVLIRNLLLFSIQIGLSLLAMHLIFRWAESRFERPAALFILALQAIYPELIYSVATIGPTIWFHLLFAGVLYCLCKKKNPLLTGLLCGILVLMRSETILPAGLLLLAEFVAGGRNTALVAVLTMILSLSPWLIRNQLQFGKPMLSASAGVNFYRGNNAGEIGDWPVQEAKLEQKLRSDPESYEHKTDSLAMAASLHWIAGNPADFLQRLPEKFLRFWWLDWPDPRTHHWLYWLPWLCCFPAGLAGLWIRSFEGRTQLMMLFLTYTFIVLVFFPQARYASLIRFFWLIPAGIGLRELWNLLFARNKFLASGS